MLHDKYTNPAFIEWNYQLRLDPQAKAEWLEALASDTYKDTQGKSALATAGGNFCCLGVWCDLQDLPSKIRDKEYLRLNGVNDYGAGQVRAFFNSYEEIESGSGGTIAFIPHLRGIPTVTSGGQAGESFLGAEVLWTSWTQLENGEMGSWQGFSLPHLNDNGFTFAQIADVIDYFL